MAAPEAAPRTLADTAAEELRRRIVSGELERGVQLPPERDLMEDLGVSRPVLREALFSLEALGFVETKSTRGRFVSDGRTGERGQAILSAWLHQHRAEIEDWDETMVAVEGAIIRALDRAGADAFVRAARPVVAEQRRAAAERDAAAIADRDAEFHRLLAAGTDNRMLAALTRELADQLGDARLALFAMPLNAELSVAAHEEILAALEAHDFELAARRNERHHVEPRRFAEAEEP